MQFTLEPAGDGATIVRPNGRLNMVTAGKMKEIVTEAIEAGTTRFIIDLSEVDFMDSSGLGALVSSLKSARQAGGDLRIASATDQVKMVLTLTNLDRVLLMHDTVADAREATVAPSA
ncbi:MAG: STAS domain-containing protein [Microbacteriaceae bacterium]